jgi:NNMT/PNMT/TEMT family
MSLYVCKQSLSEEHLGSFAAGLYLREYYSEVGDENSFLLEFFVDAYRPLKPNTARVLELGGGPTVYQLISAARIASEICFADYLEENLREVRKWKRDSSTAFDWSLFFRRALQLEAGTNPTDLQLQQRMELLRMRIVHITKCDVLTHDVISQDLPRPDIVSVNFVAESITESRAVWLQTMARIASLISDGGLLMMSGMLGARHWIVELRRYPAVFLQLSDVVDALAHNGMVIEMIRDIAAERPRGHPAHQGYDGIFCVKARKH